MSDANTAKYIVYVDTREPESIYKKLQELGEVEPIRRTLDAGDYYIPAEKYSLLVERKTVNDYINSVFDTRLWEELEKIKNTETNNESKLIPMLLVEGDWHFILKYGKKQDKAAVGSVYASLLSTIASWGFHVVSSPALSWTPYVLASFTKWLGKPRRAEPPVYKPKALSLDEMSIRVLSSFPHISVERAKKILKHYGTLKEALDNVSWWKKSIDGIGDKIVDDVKAVLHHKVVIREVKK
jgi:ERCC4-type nuclease